MWGSWALGHLMPHTHKPCHRGQSTACQGGAAEKLTAGKRQSLRVCGEETLGHNKDNCLATPEAGDESFPKDTQGGPALEPAETQTELCCLDSSGSAAEEEAVVLAVDGDSVEVSGADGDTKDSAKGYEEEWARTNRLNRTNELDCTETGKKGKRKDIGDHLSIPTGSRRSSLLRPAGSRLSERRSALNLSHQGKGDSEGGARQLRQAGLAGPEMSRASEKWCEEARHQDSYHERDAHDASPELLTARARTRPTKQQIDPLPIPVGSASGGGTQRSLRMCVAGWAPAKSPFASALASGVTVPMDDRLLKKVAAGLQRFCEARRLKECLWEAREKLAGRSLPVGWPEFPGMRPWAPSRSVRVRHVEV
ncbi:hypothetical protein Efla_001110 [Eimeria flavescens]